jgi:hypothetical protein
MNKLTATVVTRDKNKNIVSESVYDSFAVFTDKASKTMESVDVDCAEIEALTWIRSKGIFQVQIDLGGRDSSGNFHRLPNHPPALVSWSRDQFPAIWEKYGLNDISGLDIETIKQWLHDEDAVARASRDVWQIPVLESQLIDDKGAIASPYKVQPIQAPAPVPLPDPALMPPPIPDPSVDTKGKL